MIKDDLLHQFHVFNHCIFCCADGSIMADIAALYVSLNDNAAITFCIRYCISCISMILSNRYAWQIHCVAGIRSIDCKLGLDD